MYTISVETHFWASHKLTLPDGEKEAEHRHNWSVTADVSSDSLNSIGLVMDFGQLRKLLGNIVAEFDNVTLDSIDYFRRNGPSAENIAGYIYEKLRAKLPKAVILQNVKVAEELGCSAIFSHDEPVKRK